ncbi:hypothetical protein AVEN_174208-1 [Araneus ventricosus]|uniref:Phosphate/phosphite/phosphonate ABC transporter substrate-binding protein n=1 Tax=Araneus ventricosus TaxID=182803 RepID=A0A4Y2S0X3_ARAVE|nr:hypothetical protein AVEN_174208-1 [Araneus ventricosus]
MASGTETLDGVLSTFTKNNYFNVCLASHMGRWSLLFQKVEKKKSGILVLLSVQLHIEECQFLFSSVEVRSRGHCPRSGLMIAWMSSTIYLRMLKDSSPIELLPISSVHEHIRNSDRPGYYSDVIMHKDLGEKVKDFIDLRGSKWAYNCPESLSGHVITLSKMKETGENASFFGNVLYSGSHLDSIKMVIGKKVDAAAVDANCLAFFLERNSHLADEIKVLTSWGPLPPYPFVVNSKLDESVKSDIMKCLLNMHQDREGLKKLEEFHVRKFAPISADVYAKEQFMIERTKDLSFGTTYY